MADTITSIDKNQKEDYVLARIAIQLNIKGKPAFQKMKKSLYDNQDSKFAFEGFLRDNQFLQALYVLAGGSDSITCFNQAPNPQKLKKKSIILFRIDEDPLCATNINDSIVIVQITSSFLSHLYGVFNQILSPVMQNPENQQGWTDLVTKDLMERFNAYVAQVYVMIGLTKGQTLLPLPSKKMLQASGPEKDKAHIFQGSIITWTKQIKNVLKLQPQQALKQGNNPGPQTQLTFWQNKANNLNSIYQQLQSSQVVGIMRFLQKSKSTYTNPFSKLQKQVYQSRVQANDNNKFLNTLSTWFQKLKEIVQFQQIYQYFIPIMHTILLIYKHSRFYNTPPRLVVLIRQICNQIISKANDYVNGNTIAAHINNDQSVQACQELQTSIDVCQKFKQAYYEYKGKSEGEWKLTTNALFVRLNAYIERCQDILHLTNTIVQFNRLQKIDLGGTKGKTLTDTLHTIFDEFKAAVTQFRTLTYDTMDITEKRFDDDFYTFRTKIKQLERRLASVITQGFDDNDTISGKYKLLDSFQGLLNRPIIQDQLEKKHIVLLDMYKHDLKQVQSIFLLGKVLVDKNDQKAPIFNNYPPVAGTLYWCKGLKDRITQPFDKLAHLGQLITQRQQYKDVHKLYLSIIKSIKEYQNQKLLTWEKQIQESSHQKLKQALLCKNQNGLLKVNFDPALVRLLRQVKYMKMLSRDVPQTAQQIFAKADTYREQIVAQDLIVQNYNKIITCLQPVQQPLVKKRIDKMDKQIDPGINMLKWKSPQINNFIKKSKETVDNLYEIVDKMKKSLEQINMELKKFKTPVLQISRKPKPVSPEEYDNHLKAILANKLQMVSTTATHIHKQLKQVSDAVKADRKSIQWKNYTEFVNTIVINGLAQAICFGLDDINKNINSKRNDQYQLFQIKMELEGKKGIIFQPEIQETDNPRNKSVRDTIRGWINQVFSIGHNFSPRLDSVTAGVNVSTTGDYLVEIKDFFPIKLVIAQITINLDLIEVECKVIKQDLKAKYSYLWQIDPQKSFQNFIKQNQPVDVQVPQDQKEQQKENPLLKGCRQKIPDLDLIDKKITQLKAIQGQIQKIQTPIQRAWLKIDLKSLIRALDHKVQQWIRVYTDFLVYQFKQSLKNMREFIDRTNQGIKTNPAQLQAPQTQKQRESNRKVLMNVMIHISEVKDVQNKFGGVLERMKNMVLKLKKHGIQIMDKGQQDPLQSIDNASNAYGQTHKKVFKIKADILQLQMQESIQIKKKLDYFQKQVEGFKLQFKQNLPYQYFQNMDQNDINSSYKKLDDQYIKLKQYEQKAKDFASLQKLFQLQKRQYKPLKQCLTDLRFLKIMWDQISYIFYTYNDWKTKLWKQINMQEFLRQNKEFKESIKFTPKEIKQFKGHPVLKDKIDNMNTVLGAVQNLKNGAMEDRHWTQLKEHTHKQFDQKVGTFCFQDVLDLELHKSSNYVAELVDVAGKEQKIQNKLRYIQNSWNKQSFQFEPYKQMWVFAPLDNMIELLDAHSLDLMGMKAQGKYVEYFYQTVQQWRQKLGRVDSVVNQWLKVQKDWRILVNIFLGSDDIRNQLPEDTKTFQSVHSEFVQIMIYAHQNPLVVEACTQARKTSLIQMNQKIKKCQKALNDYLQQKKKVFPRFYFLSNQSLLTILSNGQNPPKVAQFIGDCFDGLKTLKFIPPENNALIQKQTVAMYSKDDQQIAFKSNFFCEGQVEIWLKDLQFKMRQTLYYILCEAKAASQNEQPRESKQDWIKDFCAQIALLTTQIVWTQDVNKAFDQLASGVQSSIKQTVQLIISRINKLISKVITDLQILERMKIINIITIDVHGRDVVQGFVNNKVSQAQSFAWQSQLKFQWSVDKNNDVSSKQFCRFQWQKDPSKNKCIIKIVDWFKFYSYEYVGNSLRLVITPLTDRCYITLTQALNLIMGGAPAGPAGTGKTETTKDLGKGVGLPVMVFNCSQQMKKDSMAQIFMGLSQSGAWGCFDQFNRISIQVLSVVSTQVKTILDAQKQKKRKFVFLQEGQINLEDTAGFFITMNPGYAGRTQLPQNLKALFRSCAMVVPDLVLICQNMLMSQGFISAKQLSKKFVSLYMLSRQLLSKQKHYDWGLRAVKSVLRQAGKLKRASQKQNQKLGQDPLLMRALRDFNIPKIVTDDKPIFLRLIGDLFPTAKAQTKMNVSLAKLCQQATKIDMGLYFQQSFIKKCIDLSEILQVRHCCFIIGPPGCGKTAVWKTLTKTLIRLGQQCQYDTLNPKAVTSDQLFGCYTKTKQWKNGVLSVIMKNQNKNQDKYKPIHKHKWSILDGDIDPQWIQSLNTVMDDNKVLTLVSNDRIPLTPSMKLLLEISNLKFATPATVSRGGVLFINEADIGWLPFMNSWLQRSQPYMKNNNLVGPVYHKLDENAKSVFFRCFQTYVDSNSDLQDSTKLTYIAPTVMMAGIQTTCVILDGLLDEHQKQIHNLYKMIEQKKVDQQAIKQVYEAFFIFAGMWAFGGSIGGGSDDQKAMKDFNGVWRTYSKIKFPDQGFCYDYYWSFQQAKWIHWSNKLNPYLPTDQSIFSKIYVSTIHTTRIRYLLEIHLQRRKPALLIGGAGTGKSAVIKDYLAGTKPQHVAHKTINFSSFTDSKALQKQIQSMLDRKSGKTYGSSTNKVLISFIDDMNMPYVDIYDTQSPIQLLRQIFDYGSIFNREQLEERKFIQDLLLFGCLNHKSGSFTIDLRLQRNFSVFALNTPNQEVIRTIFGSILNAHLRTPGWQPKVTQCCDKLIMATIQVFKALLKDKSNFSPSANKFHYQFNFRQLAKTVQGLTKSTAGMFKTPSQIFKLWVHEVRRTFQDRFINQFHIQVFRNFVRDALLKTFGQINQKEQNPLQQPIIFTSFIPQWKGLDALYTGTDMVQLKTCLTQKLAQYNQNKPAMNLVLFDQAMEHISKIIRIIAAPGGNALLVGVGGSGKQSLSRLSIFISNYQCQQMVVTQQFGMNELRAFLSDNIYKKIAKPNASAIVYLLNDSQIKQQGFLIPINDMLNSGWISDLFTKQDFEAMVGNIRNEAKSYGVIDTQDNMINFFLDKMKKSLKVILCFSPVGDTMRIRSRKFPGIINATSIDWFHPWPRDALVDVAFRFLQQTQQQQQLLQKLSMNMADIHISIDDANAKFKKIQRRNNYTTPKSFLQLIDFYNQLLKTKKQNIISQIQRYQQGLSILQFTKNTVLDLKENLRVKLIEVQKQSIKTNQLIKQVEHQSSIAAIQQKKANQEEAKTKVKAEAANVLKEQCSRALAKAKPALLKAEQCVNCLQKPAITQMKNLANPPLGVIYTAKVVMTILGQKVSQKQPDEKVWNRAQKQMNDPGRFLNRIKQFSGEQISQNIIDNANKIIKDPSKKYTEQQMKQKSYAASKLCAWSINILIFNQIFQKVKPLQEANKKSIEQLAQAQKELHKVMQQVRKLNETVAVLQQKLETAKKQKQEVENDANKCNAKKQAAQSLVNGLSGQNSRWTQNVEFLKQNTRSIIGDVLLASAFVSYIGAFSSQLRYELWKTAWLPGIIQRAIPMTEGIEPLLILTTESIKAKWKNEGLPADTMSLQNAAIITSCSRWPLLIDPQLQGSGWIRGSQGQNLTTININQKHYMRQLSRCISQGKAVLLQGVQQQIQATLDPLLSRSINKKTSNWSIELGGQIVSYDKNFKLFLMTKIYNPHFRPEIAAQCTIINFIVTQSGLEQQLLASVVNVQKNELQVQKQQLVKMQNQFQVILAQLQTDLLDLLTNADAATILDNKQLINKLDQTKKTAISIEQQSQKAKKTQIDINNQRQIYRPVAIEGAMLYFLIISLCVMDHMYQYSLQSFDIFFFRAIQKVKEDDQNRINRLIQSIRLTIYQWVARGLFQRHKLIFMTMITFRLMQKKIVQVNYNIQEMDFLIKAIPRPGIQNNLQWLPNLAWDMIQGLISLEEFKLFAQNMQKDAPNRFKDWYNELTPQDVKLPLDWKRLDSMPFKKLLVIRCLRPDRMTIALTRFIKETLPKGQQFVQMDQKLNFVNVLESVIQDSEPTTPIFFILSPGSDPVKQVQSVIKRNRDRYRIESGKSFFNIALGEGQDQVAKRRIQEGNKQGHWIMLQNIHLMPKWLIELQKMLDAIAGDTGTSHPNFRLFLSAQPSLGVPIGILDRSIKLTNQPPSGLKANMKRAFTYFPKQQLDQKQSKVKSILFGLCFFHSTVIQRRRFGPKGWNMSYPFNMGDLRDSYLVLNRYMQSNAGSSKVPFEDIIYIFGDIMYGGHIVDDLDRRLARAYLENIMTPAIFQEVQLFPYVENKANISFKVPAPTTADKYLQYIEQTLTQETPLAYGLHPNAQIGFRTTQCLNLFQTLLQLQPKQAGSGDLGAGRTTQQLVSDITKKYLQQINFQSMIFNVQQIKNKMDAQQKGPYQNVFIQQIQYMTVLITEIVRSLKEIQQGNAGELTITQAMEKTMDSLILNRVPVKWTNLAYPSKRGLESWVLNLLKRVDQLNAFRDQPLNLPKVIMISRFFNPQSYLTAIKQVVASNQKGSCELNKLYIQTQVTKKTIQQIDNIPKDGAYVFGFILQGARWDISLNTLDESKPKEMFSVIPVVYCKAATILPQGKQDKTLYQCPAYKTQDRGNTYVFTAQLKTSKYPSRKWILAGVGIIMDVQGVSDQSAKKQKQKK